MKMHELKTTQPYFDEVCRGAKRADLRKNDRDFKVGDQLLLKEYDPEIGYTGRSFIVRVTHVLEQFEALTPGYAMLSFEHLGLYATQAVSAERDACRDIAISVAKQSELDRVQYSRLEEEYWQHKAAFCAATKIAEAISARSKNEKKDRT